MVTDTLQQWNLERKF